MSDKKFIPQRRNVNRHSEHGLRLLEKSVQQDGFIDAQTAAADGEIISGSARLELSAEKFADVEPIIVESDGKRPVIVVRTDIPSASDPRAKRLSVAANQIAKTDFNPDGDLLAEWGGEDEAIRAMFADSEWTEITGEEKPTKDAQPQVDRLDEFLEKWKVCEGDLFSIGSHFLLCGDSTNPENVARVTKGQKPDCTVTDPPYGVGVDYGTFQDTPENVKDLIKKIMPIILDNLPAVFTPGVPAMWDYPRPAWVGAWVHPAPAGGCPWGFVGNNPILYYGADPYLKVGKGRRPDSVVMASDRQGMDGHPTPKPLKVWEWLVERMTPNEGMTVLDVFGGSGTTLVACQNTGRNARVIELEPKYCALQLERMSTAFPDLDIRRLE